MSVPAALLSLLLEERIPSVENLIRTVETEFVKAKKNLQMLQSNYANTQQLLSNAKSTSNKVAQRALIQLKEMRRERTSSAILSALNHTDSFLNNKNDSNDNKNSKENIIETHTNMQRENEREIDTAENKVDTLKRGHEVLKSTETNLHTNYMDCLNLCLDIIDDEFSAQHSKEKSTKYVGGVALTMGGARLKRSVMKKSTSACRASEASEP